MRNTRLEMRLLAGAGGAEISGVDVAQDLDDGTVGEIRDALCDRVATLPRRHEDSDRRALHARGLQHGRAPS